jgi:hypothetical protein
MEKMMRALAIKTEAMANGRDAIESLKVQAQRFKHTSLPKAAAIAETAGQTISDLALSTSKSVSHSLRKHQLRKPDDLSNLLSSIPLVRSASRFAMRNPALLATAGVAVAAIGYLAWRSQQSHEQDDVYE